MTKEDFKRKLDKIEQTCIGSIHNYYGGLGVLESDGKYYWSIDCRVNWPDYEEIPKSLYDELIKFEESVRDRKEDF